MWVDSLILPECNYRPGSFVGLMTIYESNYIKLKPLIDGLDGTTSAFCSTATEDCDLYLEFIAKEAYTTTLSMTYRLEDAESPAAPLAEPDLTLRVYHDARLVEAVGERGMYGHHKLQELARAHSDELDRRWRRNIMLNKWLDYLLEMAHRFESCAQPV